MPCCTVSASDAASSYWYHLPCAVPWMQSERAGTETAKKYLVQKFKKWWFIDKIILSIYTILVTLLYFIFASKSLNSMDIKRIHWLVDTVQNQRITLAQYIHFTCSCYSCNNLLHWHCTALRSAHQLRSMKGWQWNVLAIFNVKNLCDKSLRSDDQLFFKFSLSPCDPCACVVSKDVLQLCCRVSNNYIQFCGTDIPIQWQQCQFFVIIIFTKQTIRVWNFQ